MYDNSLKCNILWSPLWSQLAQAISPLSVSAIKAMHKVHFIGQAESTLASSTIRQLCQPAQTAGETKPYPHPSTSSHSPLKKISSSNEGSVKGKYASTHLVCTWASLLCLEQELMAIMSATCTATTSSVMLTLK